MAAVLEKNVEAKLRLRHIADVIRVRGYRSLGESLLGEMPLTPTLSPQERGEGEERAQASASAFS
jgi:hypothetical protein